MYQSLKAESGVQSVNGTLAQISVQQSADGLEVDTSKLSVPAEAGIPDRLRDWLINLRLLRNLPLPYLLPDPDLLPVESIRFFFVDPTWVDRAMDGVFSAANTGSVDMAYSLGLSQAVRKTLDDELSQMSLDQVGGDWEAGAQAMTGMLIRSDLVRRWPDMIVKAFQGTDDTKPMAVLRAEPVAKDIYIALFAGQPQLVEIREPHVGVRYGVEGDKEPYNVERRAETGQFVKKRDDKGNLIPETLYVYLRHRGAAGSTDSDGTVLSAAAASSIQNAIKPSVPSPPPPLAPAEGTIARPIEVTTATLRQNDVISTFPPAGITSTPIPPPRVINVKKLATSSLSVDPSVDPIVDPIKDGTARLVGLQLERLPYVQRFLQTVDESEGSVPVLNFMSNGVLQIVSLGKGRVMRLDALAARAAMLAETEKG